MIFCSFGPQRKRALLVFYASNKVLERVVRKVLTFVARDKSKNPRGSSGVESAIRKQKKREFYPRLNKAILFFGGRASPRTPPLAAEALLFAGAQKVIKNALKLYALK